MSWLKNKVKFVLHLVLGHRVYSVFKTLVKIKCRFLHDHEVSILNNFIHENGCCIDIGANNGEYSYHLSKLVGNNGHVICFEPLPNNVRTMKSVFRILGVDNAVIIGKALSDFSGQSLLIIPYKNGILRDDMSKLSNQKNNVSGNIETVSVEVIRLDDIIHDLGINTADICFIKCDVEGKELDVFKGAESLLRNVRPIVFTEIWLSEKLLKENRAYFNSLNYTHMYFFNEELVHMQIQDVIRHRLLNSFFIPDEKIDGISRLVRTQD